MIHVLMGRVFCLFSGVHLLETFQGWFHPPKPLVESTYQDCVGLATAAFGFEVLEGKVKPGVWFPVDPQASTRWGTGVFRGHDEGWIFTDTSRGKSWIGFLFFQ